MNWCPITKEECKVECACFANGECCIASLPVLVEKLEDVTDSINNVKNAITDIAKTCKK